MESVQDSTACIRNFIVAEEISMQNYLRYYITDLLKEATASRHWSFYPFAEEANGISIVPKDQDPVPLAFPLRKPHVFDISFIILVNQDSLHAWQNWYSQDMKEQLTKSTQAYQQAASDPAFQQAQQVNMDSANYYVTLQTRYVTEHMAEYQKAIVNNNQSEIKKYEAGSKKLEDKIDYWTNKSNAKTEETLSAANKTYQDFTAYNRAKTISFRNACMLRIKFSVNATLTNSYEPSVTQPVKPLNVAGSSFSLLLHNSQRDEKAIFDLNQFTRNPDYAIVLFGKWDLNPDQSHGYHARYTADIKNMDKRTPKRIGSDKIQTVAMYVEGSPWYIDQLLRSLNTRKLSSLMIK